MNPLNTIKKREEVEHKGQMTYNPVSVNVHSGQEIDEWLNLGGGMEGFMVTAKRYKICFCGGKGSKEYYC